MGVLSRRAKLTTVRPDHLVISQPTLLRYARRRWNAQSSRHAEVLEKGRAVGSVRLNVLISRFPCLYYSKATEEDRADNRIDIHVGLWRKGEGDHLLEGADWVVDAIDNIDTKVDLLTYCAKNKIKVFSSMGSGAKRDPTRIQMA